MILSVEDYRNSSGRSSVAPLSFTTYRAAMRRLRPAAKASSTARVASRWPVEARR